MEVNRRFSLMVAVTMVFAALTGCGGGNNTFSFPPPSGSFTNANLNGPFAFAYSGTDGAGFLAVAGSFQADGNGHVTSGMQDVNSGFGILTNTAFTGTYTVRADGRGTINLNAPTGNSTIDFVIVSGGHALITRFDANATGSGTIDLQTTSAFSNTALAGTFAFNLSGIDTAGNPLTVAGNFTSDSSGAITAGVDDSNDSGAVITNDPLSGTIPVSSNGRGAATINTVRGALTFAFYVVDATHLKMVEVDNTLTLEGDAFRQIGPFSNASVTGPFAFTLAGTDILNGTPYAAGGVLTSNGAGIVTSGAEDFNDGGTVTTSGGLSGSYTMAANGRGTLQIVNSNGTFNFVLYPSSGGVLALETDTRFVTSGAALQQQSTAFGNGSLSGTYGLNFTGVSSGGNELDAIAQFKADGASQLSGIIDVNNTGSVTFGQGLTGNFAVTANGRTTLTLQSQVGTQHMAVYLVDGTRALFIELDTGIVVAGDIRHQ